MLNRIKKRNEARAEIAQRPIGNECHILLLISQSLDDYIEQRITADKTIEGILKDIQSNAAAIAEKKAEI